MSGFSYQLYSSRNFGPLEETVRMLGGVGYDSVEGYGAVLEQFTDLLGLKKQLDTAGLTMPTAHIALGMLEDDPDHVVEICRAMGLQCIFLPYLAPQDRPSDADGWSQLGRRVARAAVPVRKAGFGVGWHNHDFECVALPDDSLPMDHLCLGDPELRFEFDVAWAVKAGADPYAIIAAHGDRLTAAHIKDIAAPGENQDEDGWADVGHGILDWPKLLKTLRDAGCTTFIAEHDNPKDDSRFARNAIASLKQYCGLL